MKNPDKLTLAERELVVMVRQAIDGAGMTNSEIAAKLNFSSGTIISHFRYGLLMVAQGHVANFCKLFNLDREVFTLLWVRATSPVVFESLVSAIQNDVRARLEGEIARLHEIAVKEMPKELAA